MSEDWKVIRIVSVLSDLSVESLKILLAMIKLELLEREGKVK